jgi:hypothetical protein
LPHFLHQVARHTSRILPVSGESPDEGAPVSAVSTMTCGIPHSLDLGAVAVSTAPAVAPLLPSKAVVTSTAGVVPKLASNQLPPHILAELQVCWLFLTCMHQRLCYKLFF